MGVYVIMTNENHSKSEMQSRVAAWIKHHSKASGMKDAEIASRIGLSRDEFNKLKNNRRNALWHEVVLLSQLFATDAPVSLVLESTKPVSKSVALRNSVAVGVWREARDMALSARMEIIELPIVGLDDGLERFVRRVDDGHADLFVPMGFLIAGVEYHLARTELRQGDYVVIERRRGDLSDRSAMLIELSVRRIAKRHGKWILEGCCSVKNTVQDIEYSPDDTQVGIVDLVIMRLGPVPGVT